jgi:hypothetical protein
MVIRGFFSFVRLLLVAVVVPSASMAQQVAPAAYPSFGGQSFRSEVEALAYLKNTYGIEQAAGKRLYASGVRSSNQIQLVVADVSKLGSGVSPEFLNKVAVPIAELRKTEGQNTDYVLATIKRSAERIAFLTVQLEEARKLNNPTLLVMAERQLKAGKFQAERAQAKVFGTTRTVLNDPGVCLEVLNNVKVESIETLRAAAAAANVTKADQSNVCAIANKLP